MKRNLFEEISEGFDALAMCHAAKVSLRLVEHNLFLGFLSRDIANHPERLQTEDAPVVRRLQSLVGHIDVDLDGDMPTKDV
jgi:hypothetical protein